MYIDPFWGGILTTLFAELVGFIALTIILTINDKNGGKK